MSDKVALLVMLAIVGVTLYVMAVTAAQLSDPAFMCESAFGDGWEPVENVTTPGGEWACEAPNGTVETIDMRNATNKASADAFAYSRIALLKPQ